MVEVFHVVRRVWDTSLRFRVGVQRCTRLLAHVNSKQSGILKVAELTKSLNLVVFVDPRAFH